MAIDLDLRERSELCDLFTELGPDAPTLSGEWTTADLAAHLVVRERDLIGSAGIMVPWFAGFTESRMEAQLRRHGYQGLVDLIRSGPPFGPMKIAAVRRFANLVEFYVHHEDVRRADGREPRTDRPDLDDALWGMLTKMAPLMVRKAGVKGVELALVRDDGSERRTGSGPDQVSIVGPAGELVLELYGRRSAARVVYDGPDAAVARVKQADFGI
ncbi:TIGR03085 family metal-binding protein [Aquihabitans sp. McL0605]|uniref:TIGR03085 family metal-binding protein n=1 Tax=Aquihabitans sp. McL0605 TaxID=3415671 RepID=UPI003CE68774